MVKNGKYEYLTVVKKLSEALIEYRKSHKMSQESLALEIGISPKHLLNIENCNTRCTIEVLSKIKNFTKINTDFVLSEEVDGE